MIDDIKTKLIQAEARKDKIYSDIDQRKSQIKLKNRELKNTEEAQLILQTVAQQTQMNLEKKISEIVSLALSAVFEDPYKFKIQFEIKRGKTEANISFTRNGISFDPMTEAGGGVVVIAAFALRIVSWYLQTPKSRNTLLLDEPFHFLSHNWQAKASEMLAAISKNFNLQFIIVTHIEELKESADRIFEVTQKNGISSVEMQEII